ncbi:hypothetical protein [Nocardia sp. CA-290969]|uniref:hypothetical protein n=1 Tax=Nocardia sp. CA-290969 TaxID=3239986 RepID=UPI003D8B5509
MSEPLYGEARRQDIRQDRRLSRGSMPASGAARFLALQRLAGNRAVADRLGSSRRIPEWHLAEKLPAVQRDWSWTRSERYEPRRPGDPPPSGGGPGYGMNSRGARQIANGTFRWWLDPQPGLVNARIEFTPTSTLAAVSKTIAFVQTVQASITTGIWGRTSTGLNEVDKGAADRDPFFGRSGVAATTNGATNRLRPRLVPRTSSATEPRHHGKAVARRPPAATRAPC